ncbi:Zinc finger C2CH-type [Trinorchestia longiramus]|nr:Zinc finger C2CH-type [Trinorchestia longiramus]
MVECGVVNCRGNYNKENRRRVFHLPKEQSERQKWLDVLPPRENFVANPDKFFICEMHCGIDPPFIKLRDGSMRPGIPPSIFNVPASCLPSPKLTPRPVKEEDQQLRYFLQKNKITSLDSFKPERTLPKQYKNLIISRSKESVFKNGISVPLFKTLHPNNGLRSYTQFNETVRLGMNYDSPFDKTIQNVVTLLQAHPSACVDTEKEKKLVFLTRQLELLLQKQFSMNDYCFALQSYPKCNYEQLRDFLVLPRRHKLQCITSSIDKDQVMRETFDKAQTLQQKNVFLLVDEVQIRLNAEECSPSSDLCQEGPVG